MRPFKFLLVLLLLPCCLRAQTINSAYAKTLQAKYPSAKSDLCAACKVWINPYFSAIADTNEHRPVVTYYVYTKAHRLEQESLGIPRIGTYAAWTAGAGQASEKGLYAAANQESTAMVAKGHCQAWILLAWCVDAAILSDTYTFNAAMEYQGQNIGTELATEELCRKLTGYRAEAVTDSVKIWCGTFGNQRSFSKGTLTDVLPAYYYKIIRYKDPSGHAVELCYWMPNQPDENRAKLPQRIVSHTQLAAHLGFDPVKVLKEDQP